VFKIDVNEKTGKMTMNLHHLIAVAALSLSSSAFAHPGHGTAPASEPGKPPHVHFGTAGAPASGLASRISDKDAKKRAHAHTKPVSDKAQRRESTR
jgi:hypothetical protein